MRLALPWPPSTNALFFNVRGKGRVRSENYRKWAKEAGWTLNAQRPPKFKGPVTIGIELCPPSSRRFDLDNKNKALLDLLVTHRVIEDDNDSIVREVSVKRLDSGAPCTVVVRSA